MVQGGRSGVARYIIELVRSFAEMNQNDLDLYVLGLKSDQHFFPTITEDHWITIPQAFAKGPMNLLWHQLFLASKLRQLKIDILHIPSYRRILYKSPVPQVATIHDCAPFIMAAKYDASRNFFGTKVVPHLARRLPLIFTVSQATAKDITGYMKVDSKRIELAPNGIDHSHFKPQSSTAIKAFKERHKLHRPYFIYVARLEHPAKNHIRLIQAFEKFQSQSGLDYELILPGADWHGSETIRATVETSPERNRIRLAGFVKNDDLPLWYASSEALVFPSLMEGFGIPVIEAQGCGTLVACADATSLPEVAGEAATLFDGKNIDSMSKVMLQLSKLSSSKRNEKHKQGLQWASNFTWKATAQKCLKGYTKVLNKN
ncbi:glycosyltransferase family 1 protein [Rubellicoccus peritrichatus]|uniref:Glycosyltransferase family 1 protein n=1 Tax=Rubellicoccus peritrichatus TaxID=3080537 RepID=A0AAQ3LFG5_9BACT|nr:glycosyltransferase family 1 protein [Puniceicoccus sp. CR14]WOO43747.1 glycosyltransferase family 1 protein [Puniceicoccus sp. CR14]